MAQKIVFSVVQYRKTQFPGLYCLKKKSRKNGHFLTKTLWKTLKFSTFSTSCFYGVENRFFVLEYRKTRFYGLYCLKKKVGEIAIFRSKPWVNPFGKISIFRLFQLLVFIAQKGVFSFQNIVKHIYLPYIAEKKKLEKWPFL